MPEMALGRHHATWRWSRIAATVKAAASLAAAAGSGGGGLGVDGSISSCARRHP
jgi:hypothetical protein